MNTAKLQYAIKSKQ